MGHAVLTQAVFLLPGETSSGVSRLRFRLSAGRDGQAPPGGREVAAGPAALRRVSGRTLAARVWCVLSIQETRGGTGDAIAKKGSLPTCHIGGGKSVSSRVQCGVRRKSLTTTARTPPSERQALGLLKARATDARHWGFSVARWFVYTALTPRDENRRSPFLFPATESVTIGHASDKILETSEIPALSVFGHRESPAQGWSTPRELDRI